MSENERKIRLRPSRIRFSQRNIKAFLRSQPKRSVHQLCEDIRSGTTTTSDIPRIRVLRKHNKYYSVDNRRLYVFRVLEYETYLLEIDVILIHAEDTRHTFKFTTINDGDSIDIRGRELSPRPHSIGQIQRKHAEARKKTLALRNTVVVSQYTECSSQNLPTLLSLENERQAAAIKSFRDSTKSTAKPVLVDRTVRTNPILNHNRSSNIMQEDEETRPTCLSVMPLKPTSYRGVETPNGSPTVPQEQTHDDLIQIDEKNLVYEIEAGKQYYSRDEKRNGSNRWTIVGAVGAALLFYVLSQRKAPSSVDNADVDMPMIDLAYTRIERFWHALIGSSQFVCCTE